MQLEFLTPQKILAKTSVKEIVAPGIFGEFGVLPGHAAYLTELGEGLVQFLDGQGKSHRFQVRGGYLEVVQDCITLVVEEAQAL